MPKKSAEPKKLLVLQGKSVRQKKPHSLPKKNEKPKKLLVLQRKSVRQKKPHSLPKKNEKPRKPHSLPKKSAKLRKLRVLPKKSVKLQKLLVSLKKIAELKKHNENGRLSKIVLLKKGAERKTLVKTASTIVAILYSIVAMMCLNYQKQLRFLKLSLIGSRPSN